MKSKWVLVFLVAGMLLPAYVLAQADFSTSLHGTRQGKVTWYEDANGFMQLTQVPMDSLPCLGCHPTTFANGDTVDPAIYAPDCKDCHDFAQGTAVAQTTCLGCHSRQGAEINLSGNPNPDVAARFTDVHRDAGMVCTDCHTEKEMHGDGVSYTSMNQPGAMEVSCTNEGCHPLESLPNVAEHAMHSDDLYCNACHVKTVMTCYNCHFETEVQAHKKRFYGPPPMNGFVMLLNSEKHGKVATASFQSLTYGDTTFYAVGSFSGHTVTAEGRVCEDCHNTALVQDYTTSGEIPVVTWDATEGKLMPTQGVIPVPPDWQTSLKLDFVRFLGVPEDPLDNPVNPANWEFMKTGADASQMLFATPLTTEQMDKLATPVPTKENFSKSLHATRQGKATYYSAANGGFETLTNVPMDSLPCQGCHAKTYANGDTVDAATYQPDCIDCHDFANKGTTVEQSTCLGCHGRQSAEISLGAQNPLFSDVHRTAGMECKDCHTSREMHGDGTEYASLRATGAMDVQCDNEGCHPASSLSGNPEHDQHLNDVYCAACHVQTVVSCYSCHFETEVQAEQKRFFGPPPTGGFALLVRRPSDGKVTTATYQSATFEGHSFYTIGRFNGHTVTAAGRECQDCHNNAAVQEYNNSGSITVAKWDSTQQKVEQTQGIIPVPPDWQQALKFDFITYTGEVTDPVAPLDPTKWELLTSEAEGAQMMFAEPLTTEQMTKLSMPVSVQERSSPVPKEFALIQNYPNPFNPGTTIEFHLAKATRVTLTIYNLLGQKVQTVLLDKKMNAGVYRIPVSMKDLSSGVYIYRIDTPEFKQTRKMTYLR